jgi:hypothetical protein
MKMPKVFVSYSWENQSHRDWVRELATALAAAGIEVRLDQWDLAPGESLTAFMEHEVANADYVVAVCTPAFASKSDGRHGGVGYEQQIVSGALLTGSPRSKFIPIIRAGEPAGENRALPHHFSGTFYLDFRDDATRSESVEALVRAIFKAPRHQRPSLGSQPHYVTSTASKTEADLHVELDERLLLNAERAELLAFEISDVLRRNAPLRVTFFTPGYSEEKQELSTSQNLTASRKLELMRTVNRYQIYDHDRDDLLSESIHLLVDHVYSQLSLRSDPSAAAVVISRTVERFSPAYAISQGGSKFDIVFDGYQWSFGVRLSKKETEELEEREGTERKFMTLDWGLRIDHLHSRVVLEKVIPGMVQEFLWNKYARKKPPDAAEFFKISRWRVGLG